MAEAAATVKMNGKLSDLDLETEYRSDRNDLVRDFYVPCMELSTLYRRAVGYFTSRGLSVAAQGITALVNGDGRMLLVASPVLDSDDLEAIEKGYLAREDVVSRSLLRQIESTPDSVVNDRLGYLAWLVAEGRLEVRIAVALGDQGLPCGGVYHEKMGIFSDYAGSAVVFTGSPNETAGGLIDNFETADVFCSWRDPEGRVTRKVKNFERLWNNETARLEVIPFPEAAREHLLRYRPAHRPRDEASRWMLKVAGETCLPRDLWGHQCEAIEAWEKNRRAGVVSMATGTGKTLTALVAAERCPNLSMLVVAVPRSALVEQWRDELEEHTRFRRPVLAYESAAQWQGSLFNRLRAVRRKPMSGPVVVIGTLSSLSGSRFASVLADSDFSGNALLIADEVHNVGAPTYRRTLRSEFNWRLGLSATPARHFDEEGTQIIHDYFGATVFSYDMRKALRDGYLSPYCYFVYPAHLTEDEYEEYVELSKAISRLRGSGVPGEVTLRTDNRVDGDSEEVKQMLFRRARILKKCESKLKALEKTLESHRLRRSLVYCADNEQLADVTEVLRRKEILHLTYTADTTSEERRSALESLAAGHVPVLVAIDCLDEGVDVPTVDVAIIVANSSNKRQFIQRRGRILRRAPGKSIARLADIVALPPVSAGREAKRMLMGELARVKEMAELAENKYQALQSVKEFASQYGVLLTELLSGEGDG